MEGIIIGFMIGLSIGTVLLLAQGYIKYRRAAAALILFALIAVATAGFYHLDNLRSLLHQPYSPLLIIMMLVLVPPSLFELLHWIVEKACHVLEGHRK